MPTNTFFLLPEEMRGCLVLHIYKSQAGSQFGEALRKESEDAETKAFTKRERRHVDDLGA